MSRTLALVLLLAPLAAQEIAVPEFDTKKAKASYIVASPKQVTGKLPLILDFHGAAAPARKGANITHGRVWSKFVQKVPALVVGLNSRTRSWNSDKDPSTGDTAYALHVLDKVQAELPVDTDEVYLAGFSSGADFLCSGGLQLRGSFQGSLVVCPGPPNVVGLRDKEILRVKEYPFVFVTGEKDFIRKAGAWQAFLVLEKAGAKVLYREVDDLGHVFPDTEEYEQAFHLLRVLAGKVKKPDWAGLARYWFKRGDYLLASTFAKKLGRKGVATLEAIERIGARQLDAAGRVSWQQDPGRAYESYWRVMVQFHRFPEIAKEAEKALAEDRGLSNRDLLVARGQYFKRGGRMPVPVTPDSAQDKKPKKPKKSKAAVGPWSFDKYLNHDELTERMQLLAKQFPRRVKLESMGKSVGGRDLWVCTITDDVERALHKPAIYVQGGIHGNEISATMVTLYFAWQMGANPDRRRSIDRLLRDTTFYVAPSVSPDAMHEFVTQPNSLWRPRFNFRPHDADGDGRIDEDGYEDLNGDGEISQMYVVDPQGVFVLKDGKMVRDRTGKVTPRFRHVGREGVDNDGDGKFSEDPIGGVNLNRNFPVGCTPRTDCEGFRGPQALSEPETQAIVRFVKSRSNINVFFDYHNAANCVFYWIGPDGQKQDAEDFARMAAIAGRAKKELGFAPRPLAHNGVGLSIAWAYGEHCLPACIVELEVGDPKAWGGDVFVKATRFQHPQLGEVWIGNDYKKLPKRNPPPRGIYDQCRAHWEFMRDELKELPKLALEQPRIVRKDGGLSVTGFVANTGKTPFESHRSRRLGKAQPMTIRVRGAKLAGTRSLAPLAAGERQPFSVMLTELTESVTLVVSHPKGGTVELPVLRRRVATIPVKRKAAYEIRDGYDTVESLPQIALFQDNGPRFKLTNRKKQLRVAVLLGEFADLKHTVPAKTFAASLFAADYKGTSFTGQPVYGSVRDFYQEMSYGKLDVAGRVFAWEQLPGLYADYAKASFGSSKFRDALETAVLKRHGAGALDGFDGIVFVWAGNPVRRVSCLWPMRLKLKHRPGVISFKTGEFYHGHMAAIGVACHELGHTFGVNDKYGLGAPKLPLGRWCLMCKGHRGAGQSTLNRPFHLCAWCKSVIGWIDPIILMPEGKQRLALRPILSGGNECIRILLKDDGSEYLLLTNRRREGFFTELPSPGLVVLKVGPNSRPTAPQKQVQLLPAHGLGPARRSELQELDRVAWPQPGKTELTVGKVKISDIAREGDVVYFTVEKLQ